MSLSKLLLHNLNNERAKLDMKCWYLFNIKSQMTSKIDNVLL